MLKAYLRVSSHVHDPEYLTRMLSLEADVTRRRGERVAENRPPSVINEWRRLVSAGNSVDRFEEIAERVQSWGLEFAQRLGELARGGQVGIELSVIQEIRDPDDAGAKGIHFDAGLIAWLATASASVDIDQYLYDLE